MIQQLGDYKLYHLVEPTDVAAQQTKQIQFLDQQDVPFARIYAWLSGLDFDAQPSDEPATVIVKLRNRDDAGLGKPLPAGDVSVMEPGPDGSLVLAGQHGINDICTPWDCRWRLRSDAPPMSASARPA